MNDSKFIKLQSITYATKARNILSKYGISSDIIKAPGKPGVSSCGYSLNVPYRFDEAVNILKSKGFVISEIGDSDKL